jgi:hypothetical protein
MSGNMEYYNARNIRDKRSLIPARIKRGVAGLNGEQCNKKKKKKEEMNGT